MGKHISLAAILEGQHITADTCLGGKNVAVTVPFVHSFYSIYFFWRNSPFFAFGRGSET